MAAVYQQEGEVKIKELTRAIADKEAEAKLAQAKLQELKNKPVVDVSVDDKAIMADSIQNLEREAQNLSDDIKTYKAQQEQLKGLLVSYQAQSDGAKLWMFNSQQAIVPILQGLETVNAQGLKMLMTDKTIETEWVLN